MTLKLSRPVKQKLRKCFGLPARSLRRHVEKVLSDGVRVRGDRVPVKKQGQHGVWFDGYVYIFIGNELVTFFAYRSGAVPN